MIKELPQGRPLPDSRAGISRRDIAWREAALRAAPRLFRLPGWADAVLVVAMIGYLLAGLALAPLTLEETVQESLTSDAATLLTQPGELLPGGTATAASPPADFRAGPAGLPWTNPHEAVRLAYGSLTRYLTAAGWYAAGGRATDAPRVLDDTGEHAARLPGEKLKLAARSGPALMGAIGIVVLYALTRRLFGRGAAWLATLAYALHPTLVLLGRQSVDAGLTLTLGLATVFVAAGLSRTLARGEEPRLGTWTALSLLAGLTLASGPDAVPYLGGALAFAVAGLVARRRQEYREHHRATAQTPAPPPAWSRRSPGFSTGPIDVGSITSPPAPAGGRNFGVSVGWLAVSAVGAVLVWVLVSPALWGWLPSQLATRHRDRPALIALRLLEPSGPDDHASRLRSLGGVLTDPFLTPRRYADAEVQLAEFARHTAQVNRAYPVTGLAGYQDSWRAGLPYGSSAGPLPGSLNRVIGLVAGVLLTLAALAGAVLVGRQSRRVAAAFYGWLAVTALWLVAEPSSGPGHEAPLIALACLLAAAPVPFATRFLVERDRTRRTLAAPPEEEDRWDNDGWDDDRWDADPLGR
jgi:hypothetical protein